jgi:hypothetical protein
MKLTFAFCSTAAAVAMQEDIDLKAKFLLYFVIQYLLMSRLKIEKWSPSWMTASDVTLFPMAFPLPSLVTLLPIAGADPMVILLTGEPLESPNPITY